jgi:type VI secretion system VasI family protein
MLTIGVIVLVPNLVRSQDRELATCAVITDPLQRLACYDDLAKVRGVTGSTETKKGAGKWQVLESVSAIDDSRTVLLALTADSPISAWPSHRVLPMLLLRCQSGRIEAYIATQVSPAVERGVGVTGLLRFDKEKAESVTMSKSTDQKSLFFSDPVGKINKMLGHEQMLFQFTPYNSSPALTTFTLTGLNEVIEPLRQACKR